MSAILDVRLAYGGLLGAAKATADLDHRVFSVMGTWRFLTPSSRFRIGLLYLYGEEELTVGE
ncbi:MAG: hypothetical protein M1389_14370 [Chloroflexi bacterium]|nr:hypothetical protein [Chloroflexota bacterium]